MARLLVCSLFVLLGLGSTYGDLVNANVNVLNGGSSSSSTTNTTNTVTTITNGTTSNGAASNRPVPNGPASNGSVPNGPVPNGPVPNGPVPNGPVPNGPVSNGPVYNGAVYNGAMFNNGAYSSVNNGSWASSRINYPADDENSINILINNGLSNYYNFLAASAYFGRDDVDLKGFSKVFKRLSKDQRWSAEKLIKYQNMRGGFVQFQPIGYPNRVEYRNGLDAFTQALQYEKDSYSTFVRAHASASANGDPQLANKIADKFLHKKLKLVEEIAGIVRDLQRANKRGGDIYVNNSGYNNGYNNDYNNGYNNGYNTGYGNGYHNGHNNGYNNGEYHVDEHLERKEKEREQKHRHDKCQKHHKEGKMHHSDKMGF